MKFNLDFFFFKKKEIVDIINVNQLYQSEIQNENEKEYSLFIQKNMLCF